MMSKFRKSLEDKADHLSAIANDENWGSSIAAMIRREITLTTDQIKRLKNRHDDQLKRLLRLECYVCTDLKQMQNRQPRYLPYHFPEKEKLKQRLFDIEKERRNLSLRLEEKTQNLEERLLSLINKHQQLDF